MNGAVPTWKLYWCVLTERNSCLWLPPGDMAVRVLLECVSFLGRWSYITTGPLSAYQSPGGGGGQLPPGTVEPDKSSLWMALLPLGSVILIVVTCICFQFSRGRIQTPPPLQGSWVAIMPPPPPSSWQKNLLRPCVLASKKPATSQFLDD